MSVSVSNHRSFSHPEPKSKQPYQPGARRAPAARTAMKKIGNALKAIRGGSPSRSRPGSAAPAQPPKEWWTLGDTSATTLKVLTPEGAAREH